MIRLHVSEITRNKIEVLQMVYLSEFRIKATR